MGYRDLKSCVADLERTRQLVRIDQEIDPYLEAAAIHRRVYKAGGPAVYYSRVKGCAFPMVSNLFGTMERTRFLFRDTLAAVNHLIELRVDPSAVWKHLFRYRDVPRALWNSRPRSVGRGPILANQTTIDRLPQLQCWPKDGGAFVTLPVVYTEDAGRATRTRISACIGFSFQAVDISLTTRSVSTTRSIAGSASTTRRRFGGECPFARTFSSGAHLL
jgi:4-hydroxy-3-polyprenylbenzoate decarboxylase